MYKNENCWKVAQLDGGPGSQALPRVPSLQESVRLLKEEEEEEEEEGEGRLCADSLCAPYIAGVVDRQCWVMDRKAPGGGGLYVH